MEKYVFRVSACALAIRRKTLVVSDSFLCSFKALVFANKRNGKDRCFVAIRDTSSRRRLYRQENVI